MSNKNTLHENWDLFYFHPVHPVAKQISRIPLIKIISNKLSKPYTNFWNSLSLPPIPSTKQTPSKSQLSNFITKSQKHTSTSKIDGKERKPTTPKLKKHIANKPIIYFHHPLIFQDQNFAPQKKISLQILNYQTKKTKNYALQTSAKKKHKKQIKA